MIRAPLRAVNPSAPARRPVPVWFKAACAGLLGMSWGSAAPATFSGPLIPPRPAGASGGQAIAESVTGLDLPAREAVVQREILSGNVPEFLRRFVEVPVRQGPDTVLLRVAPDYLAVGTEDDFFQTPLTPGTAHAIADKFGCVLPTRRMVDAIHAAAGLKLDPTPRPPAPDMTTVPAFLEYQATIRPRRLAALADHPWGTLVAGHQKDLVTTPLLADRPEKVAIYGWHRLDGTPIQPLFTGHAATWVDYSHGVRLIADQALLNGQPSTVTEILTNPKTAALLSGESPPAAANSDLPDPQTAAASGEILTTLEPEPGIRIVINQPAAASPPGVPVKLVVYALPNGNTIGQTMGRRVGPGEDWHYGIQHIAAQTRFLRALQPEVRWIAAYVECAEKSWPAWCRKHPDSGPRIAAVIDKLRQHAAAPDLKLVLTGHSGGGAFLFRYLDSLANIPEDVERLAFLDSNYAYNPEKGHAAKLTAWLHGGTNRFLPVIAYHDSIALLDGKTFVSEKGGTWGRSHAMLEDLGRTFAFTKTTSGPLQRHAALQDRVTFLLMENPEKAVLHTRLVERNGYLHALLTGTSGEGRGYTFFGEPAYRNWITGP